MQITTALALKRVKPTDCHEPDRCDISRDDLGP
jgi:hypothetical protein